MPNLPPSPAHEARSDEAKLLAVLVMAWMFLFGLIGSGLVGPNRSSIEREFGLSHAQYGAAFAAIQVLCAFGALTVSSRFRRFEPIDALLGSICLQTAGFAAVSGTRSAAGLAAGWTLVTLGTTLGFVVNSLSAALWLHDPARGVTLLHGWNGVGKVAGPLLAALCLAVGWRLSFLATGAASVALLVPLLLRRKLLHSVVPTAGDTAPTSGSIWSASRIGFVVLPFALLTGGNVAFAALVPLYYETTQGMSAERSSLLLTAHLFGVAAGRFALMGARLSPNTMIAVCLLAGLSVFPALHSRSYPVLALCLFGVGVMFSGTWPGFYAQAARFFPHSPHLLDYGSAVGSALGIAVCMIGSGLLMARSPALALVSGPVALWLFGLFYFLSPLSRLTPDDPALRKS